MKLIFIHGSGGCKESWQYQTRYFKDAEAIDLPGHPDGEPCSTIDDYTDWLHEYITTKGYRDLVIIGHKGKRRLERFLRGSVTAHVAHHAPCSVLCVRSSN